LTHGMNTVRVVRYNQWSIVGGNIHATGHKAEWQFELKNEYVETMTISESYGTLIFRLEDSLVWNNRLYVYRHDGLGFVMMWDQNRDPSIGLFSLLLTPGYNTVRVVSSDFIWGANNGIPVRNVPVGYWSVYLNEPFESESILITMHWGTGFEWERASSSTYRIYVDRNDGYGFVFVGTQDMNPEVNNLALTEGQNTLRIVRAPVRIDYLGGGVANEVTHVGHLVIEVVHTTNVRPYEFRFEGNLELSWRIGQTTFGTFYDVYINRHDGEGFEFLRTAQAWGSRINFAEFGFVGGDYTIRIVAIARTSSGNVITYTHNTAEWDFYLALNQQELSYIFDTYFDLIRWYRFSWSWGIGAVYNVYLDRQDGKGFEFVWTSHQALVEIGRLELVSGKYVLRVVSRGNTNESNGVLTLNQSIGVLEFTYQDKGIRTNEYQVTISNNRITWNGALEAYYRVYADRHDGKGFVFIGSTSTPRIDGILIASFELTTGTNTVRFVRVNIDYRLEDGRLTRISDIGYWTFELAEIEHKVYEFATHIDEYTIMWESPNTPYNLYVNRADGKGYVFFATVWGSTKIDITDLELTAGENTIRFARHGVVIFSYSDGTLSQEHVVGTLTLSVS